ncbi:MAG: isoprenylcysteine carboxyl methyltransferase family protein [Dermatophilaceae bacterium]
MTWYAVLIIAVAVERVIELGVSKHNLAWARRHGGREYGFGHYPFMVFLHTALLVACVIEAAHRPFIPALGWSMFAVVVLAQALRWWCIAILGPRWNTRIVVVPGLPLVTRGPYRWMRHPNYVAVVLEGIALPLVHIAWVTAVVFTVVNAGLLRVRISTENAALAQALTEALPSVTRLPQ